MERSAMMDVVTPCVTKDHPSPVRRAGKSATSQIRLYKEKEFTPQLAFLSVHLLVAVEVYGKQCHLLFLHLPSIMTPLVSLYSLSWPSSEEELYSR